MQYPIRTTIHTCIESIMEPLEVASPSLVVSMGLVLLPSRSRAEAGDQIPQRGLPAFSERFKGSSLLSGEAGVPETNQVS